MKEPILMTLYLYALYNQEWINSNDILFVCFIVTYNQELIYFPVKATLPLFTVVLSRVLLGETQTLYVSI